MTKIAINIVLLPSDEVMDICLSINQEAIKRGKQRFILSKDLNKTDAVPQITLALAAINRSDLIFVIEMVKQIESKPLQLALTKLGYYKRLEEKRSWFTLDVTTEFKELHKTVLDTISEKIQPCNENTIFFHEKYKDRNSSSVRLINDFKKKYSYENYNPHLTLSCYDAEEYTNITLPIQFIADTLAIFHVGDGGTCRKLLFSKKLK